jgi:hypothetical protein
LTVDLSTISGAVNASWYDPTRGTLTTIDGSPFANSGTHDFAPPGKNADGDGDWVLLLEKTTNQPAVVSANPTAAATATPVPPAETATAVPAPAPTQVVVSSGFVQVNSATPQSPQTTVTVSFAQAQTTGDTNVLAIGWNDSTSDIAQVTDSAGNSYQVAAPTTHGEGISQAIYYAASIAGGPNTVIVTFTGDVPFADIRIAEYAGLDPSNPFDASASASGSDPTASSGAVTTSTSNETIVGAGITTAAFTGPGDQFTARIITTPDSDILEDQTVSTVDAYTATAPVSGPWVMQVATFH